jgi:integrase
MSSKTLRLYTDCITKKFSLESLKNGEISIEELMEWYDSFKKAYTSSKCVLKVLKNLEYFYLDKFESLLLTKKNQDARMCDLYVQCVSLQYTDTIANMKKMICTVNSKYNITELTHHQAVQICESSQDKYVLIPNKIIILKVLGYDVTRLLHTLQYRENRLEYLRHIALATKTRLKYIKEIDEVTHGIDTISQKSISELVIIAKKYKYKSIIIRVYEVCLQNTSKIVQIQANLSHTYSNLNKVDFFFLQRPTQELREIFEEVMNDHQIRLKKSSSYAEDRLKDIELRIVSFLEFTDKYTKNLPKNKSEGDYIVTFLKNAFSEQIYNLILEYGQASNYNNERVKSKTGRHHQARQRLNVAIGFLQNMAKLCTSKEYIKSLKTSEFLIQIENKSELLNWNKRRVYTDDEIKKMLEVSEESPQCTLLITLLCEVGLRNAAICNLKFCDILDETKNPKHICRVREKGNKIREFITSNNLKVKIIAYTRTFDNLQQTDFVFSRTPNKRLGYSTLNVLLKRIAVQAGVTDVNVQAHSFRHTLVGKLMDAGNRIEVVSKFMGHSSVDTTMTYYWLKNIEELSNEINNPFVKMSVQSYESDNETEKEYLNKKLDACFSIIGLYRNEINKAENIESLKLSIFEQNHRIDRVLKYLADSSVRDDTTTIANFNNDISKSIV